MNVLIYYEFYYFISFLVTIVSKEIQIFLQSLRTTFLTRKSKEPRPDDHKGAEDVLDDFELEALHNEGNTPIVKNIDINKPHAEEEVTDEGKYKQFIVLFSHIHLF